MEKKPDGGKECFHYLARNETKVVYMETEDEVVSNGIRDLVTARAADLEARRQALVNKRVPPALNAQYDAVLAGLRSNAASVSNSRLSSIWGSPWTVRMLLQAQALAPHFSHSSFLTQKALYKSMAGITGGVSNTHAKCMYIQISYF
jgi:hypothetical protein